MIFFKTLLYRQKKLFCKQIFSLVFSFTESSYPLTPYGKDLTSPKYLSYINNSVGYEFKDHPTAKTDVTDDYEKGIPSGFDRVDLPTGLVQDPLEPETPRQPGTPLRCIGCGCRFQFTSIEKAGYVDPAVALKFNNGIRKNFRKLKGVPVDSAPLGVPVLKRDSSKDRFRTRLLLCRRCYRLQHYHTMDGKDEIQHLSEDELMKVFSKSIKPDASIVLKIVDILDIESSVIPKLFDLCKGKGVPVIWLLNKMDCLPKSCSTTEVKIWVRRLVRQITNSHVDDVIPIAAATGDGFDVVENRLGNYINQGVPKQIFVVGRVNSGKSTFVNRFLEHIGYRHLGTMDHHRAVGGVSRSAIPGTTKEIINFYLPKGFKLSDTPGIPNSQQITAFLKNPEDVYGVVPRKRLQPITYPLKYGKTLLIGALARIDNYESNDNSTCLVTCYFSHYVTLTCCKTHRARDIISRKGCRFLYPPHDPVDFESLQPFVRHRVKTSGTTYKAVDDIVISGLGWVSITGSGTRILDVWVPKGVSVFRRPAMLPNATKHTGIDSFGHLAARGRGPRINRKKKKMVLQLRDDIIRRENKKKLAEFEEMCRDPQASENEKIIGAASTNLEKSSEVDSFVPELDKDFFDEIARM